MANLEKTLAEVEVLARELHKRAADTNTYWNSDYLAYCAFESAISGISGDAKLVLDKYKKATRYLAKGNGLDASILVGEMAMDCKNLAQNLNIFMQTTYGQYSGNLKSLETNTKLAPKTNDGRTLAEIFCSTHDHSKDSILKNCRDSKGHANGHTLITKSQFTKSGYMIWLGMPGKSRRGPDAQEFLDSQAQSYLEMTKTILQTIADKDTEHFRKRNGSRKMKILTQQARNFYQRHAGTARAIAGTALLIGGLIGGSLGTLQYQNIQKQREMKDTLNKWAYIIDSSEGLRRGYDNWEFGWSEALKEGLVMKRKKDIQRELIDHPENAPYYHLDKIFGTTSNLFTQSLGQIEEKQRKLGVYIDNFLAVGGKLSEYWPNPNGKAGEFLSRRDNFRRELTHLLKSTNGKAPTYSDLEKLEFLSAEISSLYVLEQDVIPYMKPAAIDKQ
jgi:hypothetical protein